MKVTAFPAPCELMDIWPLSPGLGSLLGMRSDAGGACSCQPDGRISAGHSPI